MEEQLIDLIQTVTNASPILTSIIFFVGILRVINKPLFSILKSIAQKTDTTSDDRVLEAVETSKAYQWFSYSLDWLGSIQLRKPVAKPVVESSPEESKGQNVG